MDFKKKLFDFFNGEFWTNFTIIFFQTILFSFFFSHFSSDNFPSIFLKIFLFISFLHISRLLCMKIYSYHMGFELKPRITYIDRYGFRNYQKFKFKSYFKFKLPTYIISLIISVLSYGFLVIPSIFRFETKKISHKFYGTKYRFENDILDIYTTSDHRISKVLFLGFFYYYLFALFTSLLVPEGKLLYFFYFIIFWTAGISLIPIIGFEGFDLFIRNKFAYIASVTINIFGLFSLIAFSGSIIAMFFATLISAGIYLSVIYVKKFL